MSRSTVSRSPVDALVAHLLGDESPLAAELGSWLVASRSFRAFVDEHRDKIRKKLRTAADPEARRDVRAELRAAQLLLSDRHIRLAFEAHGALRGGPDFTVTYRAGRPFNVEVTRLRRLPDTPEHAGPLLTKLRQLPPGTPNVLVVAVAGERAGDLDVAATVRALRARADGKDERFFADRGFAGARGFYERFLRLGAVITWCEAGEGSDRATSWTNPSARSPVPRRALDACLASFRRA